MVQRLLDGIARFQSDAFPKHAGLFGELANGQSPETLIITCADSRIDLSLITQSDPGDIFVVRNAGNIVPILDGDGASSDGTAASIDYAVAVLGVKHVVVCGHSSCGAMTGLADLASLDALPSIGRWLEHSKALVAAGSPDLNELIERNVLLQLEHLTAYPAIRVALDNNAIELHGWVYDIGTGIVRVHDGESFVPALRRAR